MYEQIMKIMKIENGTQTDQLPLRGHREPSRNNIVGMFWTKKNMQTTIENTWKCIAFWSLKIVESVELWST